MITNLVRAELSRLAARRFVLVMLAVLLGALTVTFATTVASSHAPTAAELSSAQASMENERDGLRQARADCEAARGTDRFDRWGNADCTTIDPNSVRLENHLSGVFIFANSIIPLLLFLAVFLALFGFLVGASFIGAELTSGGMTNLLLWRPQRLTVLGTKLGVLAATMLALSVATTLAYVGAFRLLAEVGGMPGDTGGAFWANLWWLCVRGIIVALGATALGFAIAAVGRHTAAALGVIAGYAVIWEMGGRIVTAIIRPPRSELIFLGTHLAAWLNGSVRLYDGSACRSGYSGPCDASYTLTWWQAGMVLALLLGAVLAITFSTFRRRDLA